MSNIIVLDTGVLGMLVHPAETGEPRECKTWLKKVVQRGASVYRPEIVATTNVGHLSRFVDARSWRDIPLKRWGGLDPLGAVLADLAIVGGTV